MAARSVRKRGNVGSRKNARIAKTDSTGITETRERRSRADRNDERRVVQRA